MAKKISIKTIIPPSKKKMIRDMRQASMVSQNGERASHKMSWVGDETKKRNGNFGVFPTITPKAGKEKSSNPSDWKTQTPKEAEKKGEMINVNRRRQAEKLAAGSWKKGVDKRDAMKDYRQNKKK